MGMKRIAAYVSLSVGLIAIIGALWTVDATYTRAARTDLLEIQVVAANRRIDRGEMEQTARDLRRRMWDLQGHYGEDKAKSLREYKELEQERDKILRRLKND